MKILLINDQFESGGAARVACTMCNEFKSRGYDIVVVTDTVNNAVKYDLNKEIPLRDADFRTRSSATLSRIASLVRASKGIRKHLKKEKPDVVIAIQANAFIRTWIANIGLHNTIIAADHTSFARKMDFINTFTRHYLYKYAAGLSILTHRDEIILGNKYPRKMVIYNPLTWEIKEGKTKRQKTILAAGRFDIWKTKGFDLLLNVWGRISDIFPEWKLEIAGTGNDESVGVVKSMIQQNGIEKRVTLLGQVSDMKSLYARSGVFVLSSRIEGMPMVLLEAMSQGCPCVAFDVGGASSEMMVDGGGIVVKDGDIEGLKNAIVELLQNDALRTSLSAKAITSSSRFSVDVFMSKWEELIKRTITKYNK